MAVAEITASCAVLCRAWWHNRSLVDLDVRHERSQNGADGSPADAAVPQPVRFWQKEEHIPGTYDLEIDTSMLSPEDCAAVIRQHLDHGPPPSGFERLAAMATTRDE